MSKLKVRLSFDRQEEEHITSFCHQIGLPVEKFCRQAVFYAIRDSYARAEALEQKRQQAEKELVNGGVHNTVSTDTAGDTTEARTDEAAVRDPLPNTQTPSNQD